MSNNNNNSSSNNIKLIDNIKKISGKRNLNYNNRDLTILLEYPQLFTINPVVAAYSLYVLHLLDDKVPLVFVYQYISNEYDLDFNMLDEEDEEDMETLGMETYMGQYANTISNVTNNFFNIETMSSINELKWKRIFDAIVRCTSIIMKSY